MDEPSVMNLVVWAWGGETRLDYCLRLGYERFDGVQVRKVL